MTLQADLWPSGSPDVSDLRRACRIEPLDEVVSPHDLLSLYRDEAYVAVLESQGAPSELGRFSFLCVDPHLVFRAKRDTCEFGPPDDLRAGGRPFDELRELLRRYGGPASAWHAGLPPFLGGAVGYLGYEMLYQLARVPDRGHDDRVVPDAYLCFYRVLFATDRVTRRSWLVGSDFGETDEEAARRAERSMAKARERLARVRPRSESELRASALRARRDAMVSSRRLSEADLEDNRIRATIDRERYLEIVRTAKQHIEAGDVYEVCTAQRFETEFLGTGEELFDVLRTVSEAPFGAYLRYPGLEIISSSPERFLRLDRDGWAETRPIKGTRPRGKTAEADRASYDDLASSEKDAAENVMIVDLARNDLGRVCEVGSISVPELCVIESYPFTHQLVSTVRGRLRDDVTPIDLVCSAFPGGSMTGAPKIQAMRVIDALEPVKRGVFSGAIGYFDHDGAFDLSIVIRTFVKTNVLSFHVGGAVLADSDPSEEFQETLDKAHGLVTALELARDQ